MFENGVYYSTMGPEFKKLKVETWAHFSPLFAGLYTPDEAKAVVENHMKNPDTFAGTYGVRTTSKREQAYRPHSENFSWRGATWMAEHWFIYHGLMRYGMVKEAEEIRAKSVRLLEKSGFSECFNPETGEGFGAHNFTWGSLVLDMIKK
jgi:glycogen debranching enzyme